MSSSGAHALFVSIFFFLHFSTNLLVPSSRCLEESFAYIRSSVFAGNPGRSKKDHRLGRFAVHKDQEQTLRKEMTSNLMALSISLRFPVPICETHQLDAKACNTMTGKKTRRCPCSHKLVGREHPRCSNAWWQQNRTLMDLSPLLVAK